MIAHGERGAAHRRLGCGVLLWNPRGGRGSSLMELTTRSRQSYIAEPKLPTDRSEREMRPYHWMLALFLAIAGCMAAATAAQADRDDRYRDRDYIRGRDPGE